MSQYLPEWLEMTDDRLICIDEVCAKERQSFYYESVTAEP